METLAKNSSIVSSQIFFDLLLSGTAFFMDRGELESPSEKRYRNRFSERNIATPRYDGLVKKHIEVGSPEVREYAFWESARSESAQVAHSPKRKGDELKMITGMVIALESRRPPTAGHTEFLRTCLVSVFTAGLQFGLIYCTPGLGEVKLVNRRKPLYLPSEYKRENIEDFLQEVVLFLDILQQKAFLPGSLTGETFTIQGMSPTAFQRARSI